MDISGDVHRNPHWLREQYEDEGRTVPEIADSVGVCRATIRKWMGRYGIETTGPGITPDNTAYRDPDWLAFMYHERGHTIEGIANVCGVSKSAVYNWIDKHDIKTRARGFGKGEPNPMQRPEVVERHPISGLKGEDHPSYIGEDGNWRKREPWTSVRLEAIDRDDERCVKCGLTREQHRETVGQDLDVHHIEPTSSGGARYELDNLITLCRSCHEQTHAGMDPPGK